jgi:hypothetical protein
MSLYPDWIGIQVETCTGVVLVEGYDVELVDTVYSVTLDSGIDVDIDENEYGVMYGC